MLNSAKTINRTLSDSSGHSGRIDTGEITGGSDNGFSFSDFWRSHWDSTPNLSSGGAVDALVKAGLTGKGSGTLGDILAYIFGNSLNPLSADAVEKGSFTGLADLIDKSKTDKTPSISDIFGTYGGSSGTGPSSAQQEIDYQNADLAKAYGMSAETAYMEALSNTAHQREVADLRAAGLNPVLGFSGSGASQVNASASPSASGASGASNPLKDVKDIVSIIGSIFRLFK